MREREREREGEGQRELLAKQGDPSDQQVIQLYKQRSM